MSLSSRREHAYSPGIHKTQSGVTRANARGLGHKINLVERFGGLRVYTFLCWTCCIVKQADEYRNIFLCLGLRNGRATGFRMPIRD